MVSKETSKRILGLKHLILVPCLLLISMYSFCQEDGLNNSAESSGMEFSKSGVVYVPFAVVDELPIFPGCEDAADKRSCFRELMHKHIKDNFQYPEDARKKGIGGTVGVMFTIDEEGNITNIQKNGPDKLLEDEAVRIITKLPQMTPGKQRGQAVRVPIMVPITF